MEITSQDFKAVSSAKLKDEKLQKALFQQRMASLFLEQKLLKS